MCAIQRFDAVLITEQLDHPDLAPWLLHSLGVRADAWDESDVVAGLPPVVSTTAAIPHSRLGVNKVRNNRGNDGDGGVLEPPREIRGELGQLRRPLDILGHAASLGVHGSKQALRLGIALIRGEREQHRKPVA